MSRRRLPIGMQTFRSCGRRTAITWPYIERLLHGGTHYFLSRPRRFGKSLFLDTLKEFFEGNEALFEGLYIHDRWDWSVRHPVVRLSFGAGSFGEPGGLDEQRYREVRGLLRERVLFPTSPHSGTRSRSRSRAAMGGWTHNATAFEAADG